MVASHFWLANITKGEVIKMLSATLDDSTMNAINNNKYDKFRF